MVYGLWSVSCWYTDCGLEEKTSQESYYTIYALGHDSLVYDTIVSLTSRATPCHFRLGIGLIQLGLVLFNDGKTSTFHRTP